MKIREQRIRNSSFNISLVVTIAVYTKSSGKGLINALDNIMSVGTCRR